MQKYYSIILFVLFLSGCKEIYDPEIDNQNSAIVVQGIMTNLDGLLSVKINRAVSFDSTNTFPSVDAKVIIYDDLGNTIPLLKDVFGVYSNPTAKCVSGRSYVLKFETADGNVYESSPQMLPEKYSQDTAYAATVVQETYADGGKSNLKIRIEGIETYVDLSSSGTDFPKCRYDTRVTVLYYYVIGGNFPVTYCCWRTFNPNNVPNVSISKFEKEAGLAPKHNIGFFATDIAAYDSRENVYVAGWLLHVNKYSLSNESHQFYSKLKSQLEAEGKLFDPVPSQLLGNIKCTNDPKKIVLGYFEVSFAEKLYYKYESKGSKVTLKQKDGFPGFTNYGETLEMPAFWNN